MQSQFDQDYRRLLFRRSLIIGASISSAILIYYALIFGPHQTAVYMRLVTVSVFAFIYLFLSGKTNYRIGAMVTLIYSILALSIHLLSFDQPDLAPTLVHIPLIIFAATFFGGILAGAIAYLTLSVITLWVFLGAYPFHYQPSHPYFDKFFVELLLSALFTLLIAYFFEKVRLAQLAKIQHQANLLANSAKLSSLGMMAGSIAHEVSNPLSIVIGQLEIIKKDASISNDVQQRLEKAIVGCLRISNIVDAIRHLYVKSEKNVQVETNPHQLLTDLLNNFCDNVIAADIEVQLKLSPQLRIKADSSHIEMIFKIIIENAIDALVAGGQVKTLAIDSKIQDGNLTLYFDDTGIGIDESHLTSIFEPFFTTKGFNKGMGLGLTLVHNIVQSYGWEIEAKRVSDMTRFMIILSADHFRMDHNPAREKKLSFPVLTSPQAATSFLP